MGMLDRIRTTLTGGNDPKQLPNRPRSAEPVDDWPSAVAVRGALSDPDAGFDADTAPAGTVGVLQWTPGLLVDDGAGEGFWDYWDLEAWSAGDPPQMLDGLDRDTSEPALRQRVAETLGRPVALELSTVVLSADGETWRTTPLFIVSPRA
ncbi:hypothetical protein [Phycicoccus sp. Soil748]|uniref:hypothetical protein n=1 Tax=Phycicoccus sp. Soil748 TaxID=1736397 RepID=UPI00070338FB|nr:hypothetical protein [Phycicoccus sp. Soil748]KRE55537.1 hypothetical protein ASG70_09300 [Phycicoccus sp. Soil748]